MNDFFAGAGEFLTRHQDLAGPIIFLLAFLESLVLVGLLIPGTAVMITIGGLVGAGILDPVPVLAGAVIGSILGDWVSFVLGKWLGPSAYRLKVFRSHRPTIARARLFFRRFGFFAVLLGRFLGPIRATIPLIAGVMQMDRGAFRWANVLSAMLWVPLVLAPGYLSTRKIGGFEELTPTHIAVFVVLMASFTVIAGVVGAWILGGSPAQRKARRLRKGRAQ